MLTHFVPTGFRDGCRSTQFHRTGCGININSGSETLNIALHKICDATQFYMNSYIFGTYVYHTSLIVVNWIMISIKLRTTL